MGSSGDHMKPDNVGAHISPGSVVVQTSRTLDVASHLRAKMTNAGQIGMESNVSNMSEDKSDQC